MNTLDEVIQAIEACRDSYVAGKIIKSDALHYLKEYRTLQIGYIKAMADLEDNPALTWDELKTMEGKPVWIEARNGSRWIVIESIRERVFADGEYLKATNGGEFYDKDFGELWQAYRKERK